jgi:hypothetical protein
VERPRRSIEVQQFARSEVREDLESAREEQSGSAQRGCEKNLAKKGARGS